MKILHIINTLKPDGAQSVLYQLLTNWADDSDQHMVISLRERGLLAAKIESAGIPVQHVDINPRWANPLKLLKLVHMVRAWQPDLVQTWLYHSDLLGGIATRLACPAPIVWGVHHTTTGRDSVSRSAWYVIHILSWLSPNIPTRIINCSHSAMQTHISLGYPTDKMIVILNGIDTARFQPDPTASSILKNELQLPNNTRLIGMFARYHPQKDHPTLLRAAALMVKRNPYVHFVLAGENINPTNQNLQKIIAEENLQNNVHLLGIRQDIPLLAAGLDIVTLSSSYGEALPQTIGEAMACGIPCVATDVGDIARLVANSGIIVQPEKPQQLADAWQKILELPADEYKCLSVLARKRILENYQADQMVSRYKAVYRKLVHDGRNQLPVYGRIGSQK
jgi:glycosyltransferase involved in cell wall biosynthesis